MGQDEAPPTCPECGRRAKRARALFRTRRRKRLAGAAVLITLLSGSLALMPTIQGPRPYRFVPTWMLVRGYTLPRVNANTSSHQPPSVVFEKSAWEEELERRSLTASQMLTLLRREVRFEDCFPSVWVQGEVAPIWAQQRSRAVVLPWHSFALVDSQNSWEANANDFMRDSLVLYYGLGVFGDYRGTRILRFSSLGQAQIDAEIRWLQHATQTNSMFLSTKARKTMQTIKFATPVIIHQSVDDALTPIDSQPVRDAILDAITVTIGSDGRPKAEMSTAIVGGECIASVQIDFLRADGRYCPIFLSASDRQWSPEREFMRPDEDAPAQLMRVGLTPQWFTVTDLEGCFLYIRSEPLGALAIANWTGFKHKSYWKGSMVVPLSAVKVNQ
jgi:hypothetical protein